MSALAERLQRLTRPRARLRLAGRSLPWAFLLALGMAAEHGLAGAVAAMPLVLVFLLPGAVELELEQAATWITCCSSPYLCCSCMCC